ncbi:ec3d712f-9c12-44d8-a7e8-3515fb8dbdc3 [Sclerotinia trifoliorum]|uniref:Ec3d712f-9c12-44d8-a7e8-3515fb8dbdc3 n=1 Tax=Sclerotinia trifoliorum TaxID=28548 RepID=A0A8H2VMJ6_9HELO|nr:ec3d712f-9c12-44d8-a7e8-3515fb8dbdc3 [Sclerotinia trifoliorum]
MSTESTEDQKLLQAVFKQIDLANISLNFDQLAQDLGIVGGKNPKGAASKRWSRYKQKNGLVSGKSAKNESGDDAETDIKSESNAGNGKKTGKAAGTANGRKKAGSKKRKLIKDEDEDDEPE